MADQQILITGGFGCIGSETAKSVLGASDAKVVVCSRNTSDERAERVFGDADRSRLIFVQADVSDPAALKQILATHAITDVVHMAALQTPDCNAHRDLGLQTNLAGTQHLIEAMKSSGRPLRRYVYASSIAVYGPRSAYPAGPVPMLAEPAPVNVYGVWKLAGEQISKFFHEDTGVATLCLRPAILYGPGRDAGLTASPTTAMKCVALGLPYEIPYRSRQDYQYAPDVGSAVSSTVLEPFDGYGVFTLPSRTLEVQTIVDELRQAAANLGIAEQFKITVGENGVPFICDLDFQPFLDVFPNVPQTSLDKSVRESLTTFRRHVANGWLTEQDLIRQGLKPA